jgi:hypothetical protein
MKNFFIGLAIVLGVILLFSGLALYNGWFGVYYTKTVGKAQQNAERTVFKETQSYNDGMAQQLSKLKLEYETSKDSIDKKAIKYKIVQDYADFNAENLQNEGLRQWLEKMRN